MIFAVFYMLGFWFVLSESVYMSVRYCMAVGPRCFRCLMLIWSGPRELLVADSVMACFVWAGVIVMLFLLSRFVRRSIFLFSLSVVCVVAVVNCLLKAFAMSLLWCKGLLKNVMVIFLGG